MLTEEEGKCRTMRGVVASSHQLNRCDLRFPGEQLLGGGGGGLPADL